jgi:predicted nucleic acid-binding Zn ribbon protein
MTTAVRTHHCPGCGQAGIPDEFLCCAPCWNVLPFGIRHAVLTTKRLLILHPDRRAALTRVNEFFRSRARAS